MGRLRLSEALKDGFPSSRASVAWIISETLMEKPGGEKKNFSIQKGKVVGGVKDQGITRYGAKQGRESKHGICIHTKQVELPLSRG